MLVLSRKVQQDIVIFKEDRPGPSIVIRLVSVSANSGVIGISAPPEFKILRSELMGK